MTLTDIRARAVRSDVSRTPRRRASVPPTVAAALGLLTLLIVAAAFPSVLAPHDPYAVDLDSVLSPPSWTHPFGTDLSGRDLLSRIIYGTRQSLAIGLGALAVASVLAVVLGIATGLSGRIAGALANRWIEVMFAFPTVLLGLLLVSVFGPGPATLVFAIASASHPVMHESSAGRSFLFATRPTSRPPPRSAIRDPVSCTSTSPRTPCGR